MNLIAWIASWIPSAAAARPPGAFDPAMMKALTDFNDERAASMHRHLTKRQAERAILAVLQREVDDARAFRRETERRLMALGMDDVLPKDRDAC